MEVPNCIKMTSKILKYIRQGCVCEITNEEYADFLYNGCSALKNKGPRQEILSFLTFLRAFTKFSMIAASTSCKRFHSWLIILRKMKVRNFSRENVCSKTLHYRISTNFDEFFC